MLTGKRAFDGEDIAEVLGAVVRSSSRTGTALPPDVPPPIRTLLQRCLVKDRRQRIADIAAALFVLDHQRELRGHQHGFGRAAATQTAVAARRGTDGRCAGGRRRRGALRVVRHAPGSAFGGPHDDHHVRVGCVDADRASIATSPSRPTAHASSIAATTSCWCVRSNQLEPTVLSGLGAPRGVFISPDGQWVGFFDGTRR